MNINKSLGGTIVVFALLGSFLTAGAQAEEIDGGNLRLKLAPGLFKKLKRQDVRVSGLKGAKAGRAGITMPLASGEIEGHYGGGFLNFGGGFKLQAGKEAVTVKRLLLHTVDHYLSATVNGKRLKLASTPPQESVVGFFEVGLSVPSLELTPRAAAIFNRKLRLPGVFKAGRSLGTATADVEFRSYTTRKGRIDMSLSGGFRDKLEEVEVETASPELTVPVEWGVITSDLTGKEIGGENGFWFQQQAEPISGYFSLQATTVGFTTGTVRGFANFNHPGEPQGQQPLFSGVVATLPPPAPFQFNVETGEAAAGSIPLALGPDLARALNDVFGAAKGKPDHFQAGEPYATLSFAVETR